jgi:hypothetical protein
MSVEISRNCLRKNVVEQADHAVEHRGLGDVMHGDRQNVAHQHVLEMFGLAGRLAHGEDRGSRGDRVGDADKSLLRNVSAACPGKRKNCRAHKRKRQAQPVGSGSVRIHPDQNGDGRA